MKICRVAIINKEIGIFVVDEKENEKNNNSDVNKSSNTKHYECHNQSKIISLKELGSEDKFECDYENCSKMFESYEDLILHILSPKIFNNNYNDKNECFSKRITMMMMRFQNIKLQ